jgi:Na+-transporting NADH:ubiquinone oxidoreductase subunit F
LLLELLVAVAAACGLTVFLAIIIIIADATIANYGTVTITINDEKEYAVQGGRPILAALKDEEIFIPSACGGRGSCGLCRARIAEGAGDFLPTELPWLSEGEKADGVRLTCQVKAKRDVVMYLPEEVLSLRQYVTRVERIRDLTYDIKEVTLRLVEPPEIEFRAGQFVQFEVPEYELTSEVVYRAYSMASPPSRKDAIELHVRLVPDGICTTYVHQHLKQGDRIVVNGPYGDFCLRDSDRDVLFIAGGSGMAPVRAILYDMAEKDVSRRTRYFFGARTTKDLFLVDEMRELENRLPDFRFIPALSEPDPDEPWDGETGLISDVVERHYDSLENVEAYLCGSPGMIDACIACLKKRGLAESFIFFDKFE